VNPATPADSSADEKIRTIMLVDDNMDVRAVITMGLEQLGYQVVQCVDGRDAFEKFELEKPDVAIIDQGLPDMKGIEIGRQFKKMAEQQPLTIALLTGTDGPTLRLEAQQAQFDGFFVKPVRLQFLAEWINRQIGTSRDHD
jgi:CheY-like chemotaxis protein